MLKKYNDFLTEGRGISDLIKQYSVIILDYLKENEYKQILEFNYSQLPLIDLRVNFNISNDYHGLFDPSFSYLKDNKLYNIVINIEIPEKYDDIKILGILSHELTHVKEFYEIDLKNLTLKVKIHPIHIDIKQINKEFIKQYSTFDNFYDLIYLSVDDEMNARIAQLYHYLYEFKNKDKDFLFEKVKEHKNWEYVEMLKNFDSVKFIEYNINKISRLGLEKITIDLIEKFKDKNLNKRSKMLTFIDKNLSIEDFYNEWKNYFNKKADQHIERIKYQIKEVIEDLNGNKPFNELYRANLDDPKI